MRRGSRRGNCGDVSKRREFGFRGGRGCGDSFSKGPLGRTLTTFRINKNISIVSQFSI